jgi:hypothetical protein
MFLEFAKLICTILGPFFVIAGVIVLLVGYALRACNGQVSKSFFLLLGISLAKDFSWLLRGGKIVWKGLCYLGKKTLPLCAKISAVHAEVMKAFPPKADFEVSIPKSRRPKRDPKQKAFKVHHVEEAAKPDQPAEKTTARVLAETAVQIVEEKNAMAQTIEEGLEGLKKIESIVTEIIDVANSAIELQKKTAAEPGWRVFENENTPNLGEPLVQAHAERYICYAKCDVMDDYFPLYGEPKFTNTDIVLSSILDEEFTQQLDQNFETRFLALDEQPGRSKIEAMLDSQLPDAVPAITAGTDAADTVEVETTKAAASNPEVKSDKPFVGEAIVLDTATSEDAGNSAADDLLVENLLQEIDTAEDKNAQEPITHEEGDMNISEIAGKIRGLVGLNFGKFGKKPDPELEKKHREILLSGCDTIIAENYRKAANLNLGTVSMREQLLDAKNKLFKKEQIVMGQDVALIMERQRLGGEALAGTLDHKPLMISYPVDETKQTSNSSRAAAPAAGSQKALPRGVEKDLTLAH